MARLGDWALDQATQDGSMLQYAGREIDMAVNFSVAQLDDHIVDKVRRSLEASGLRPDRLTVEATESTFVRDEGITATTFPVARSTTGW